MYLQDLLTDSQQQLYQGLNLLTIRAAVQTRCVPVFKSQFEDQGQPSWSSSFTTSISIILYLSLSFTCQESLVSVHYYKGSQVPSRLGLVSRSVLVLSKPSDVSDLVPSCLVSIALLSPTCSCHITNCLSQAYGCSDRYTAHPVSPQGHNILSSLDSASSSETQSLESLTPLNPQKP